MGNISREAVVSCIFVRRLRGKLFRKDILVCLYFDRIIYHSGWFILCAWAGNRRSHRDKHHKLLPAIIGGPDIFVFLQNNTSVVIITGTDSKSPLPAWLTGGACALIPEVYQK